MNKNVKVGIYTNLKKDLNANAAKSLISHFKDKVEFYIADDAKKEFKGQNLVETSKLSKYCDLIVAFGGDGTILKVVSSQEDKSVPILGIDLGTVGFLSESKINEADLSLQKYLDGNYSILDRSLIMVEYGEHKAYALNEIVLAGPRTSCLATFKISINKEEAVSTKGDGIMIVTPTGSTAYSLSCNGPIIAPNLNALIINSICAYPIRTAPIVVKDNSIIKIESDHENLQLIVDGNKMLDYKKQHASIIVKKTKEPVKFIQFKKGENDFYHKITKKLKIWSDTYES